MSFKPDYTEAVESIARAIDRAILGRVYEFLGNQVLRADISCRESLAMSEIIMGFTSDGVYLRKRGLSENCVIYFPQGAEGDTEALEDYIARLYDQGVEYESPPNVVELGAFWTRQIADEDGAHWAELNRLIDEIQGKPK